MKAYATQFTSSQTNTIKPTMHRDKPLHRDKPYRIERILGGTIDAPRATRSTKGDGALQIAIKKCWSIVINI